MHNPDRWIIVKFESEQTVYKVLGGWSGGYLDSDNWRLSSGLKSIEDDGDYYLMHNYSGSIYKCHKKAEGFTMLSSAKYSDFKKQVEGTGYNIDTVTVEEFKTSDT